MLQYKLVPQYKLEQVKTSYLYHRGKQVTLKTTQRAKSGRTHWPPQHLAAKLHLSFCLEISEAKKYTRLQDIAMKK